MQEPQQRPKRHVSSNGRELPRLNEERKEGVLYIGMDLGTSRTAVSASNGVRQSVLSFVGYPKDVVAMKIFRKDRVFGQEAQEKRLSLRLYRPLEHGVIKG